MKKIFLFIAVILSANLVFGQNVLSLRGGISQQFESGSPLLFGPGASFQRGINENIALGLNFDFHFGSKSGISYTQMNFEPRFDYYFNGVFNGFHAGSNFAFNIVGASVGGVSTSAKAIHLGATLGYTHPLSDKMLLDFTSGFGNTMSIETGGGSSFGIRPAVSLGFKL